MLLQSGAVVSRSKSVSGSEIDELETVMLMVLMKVSWSWLDLRDLCEVERTCVKWRDLCEVVDRDCLEVED